MSRNKDIKALHQWTGKPYKECRAIMKANGRKGWKCPFCKWRTSYGKSNFCMNCGADLRKGDET